MKLILIDVDGVLVQWSTGFEAFMQSRGYPEINKNSYDLATNYGITRDLAEELGKEFNESDHLRSLLPLEGAERAIDDLLSLDYSFTAITSVGTSDKVKDSRQKNLEGIFGKNTFNRIICLPFGGDKTEVLSQWEGTRTWWIEDKWENAKIGYDLGLKPIIIDSTHNQYFFRDKYVTIPRAKNWNEIYNIITQ